MEYAAARDTKSYSDQPTLMEHLRFASRKSGLRPLALARDFLPLQLGRGRLTFPEYVQFGLFDEDAYSQDEKARFLSNTLHWPITRACCEMARQVMTEDKWLCSKILSGSGVALPETLAVIDKSPREYPGARKISDVTGLIDFMTAHRDREVFGKVNTGICGFGVFLAEHADEKCINLKGSGPIGYEDFWENFIGQNAYIVQTVEKNHPFFDRFADALATVRVCILLTDQGEVKIPFAVLKLPSRQNIADSFWRKGNLACDLDVKEGRIIRARTKTHFETTDHARHPETGEPLIGQVLPMWAQLLELARRVAPVFYPVRYQSMDICLTQRGPVLIEVNTGGGFDLPQLASGRGFLTDEVTDFFRSCGYKKV